MPTHDQHAASGSLSRMKRCEDKIRYRTSFGAKWALWGIRLDRYLRGRRNRHERRAYACPHCNNLQPSLRAWLKRKPADVEFRRIPAVLQDSWLQLARTYYAIEAMGLVDKLHHDLFAAIHDQRILDPKGLARDPKPLFDWVASKGVDRQKFMDTYNSFAVSNRTQRAVEFTRNYDVPYTPVLVVNGRYLTSPSMKGNNNAGGTLNYDKFFQNLDQLIALARAKPAATK